MMGNRIQVVTMVLALISLLLSIFLVDALRQASKRAGDAQTNADKWERMASKAYTGYLLAAYGTPNGKIFVPKGTRIKNGRLLPPEDFCAKGMLQCDQPK